jgi:hypothetical protein
MIDFTNKTVQPSPLSSPIEVTSNSWFETSIGFLFEKRPGEVKDLPAKRSVPCISSIKTVTIHLFRCQEKPKFF